MTILARSYFEKAVLWFVVCLPLILHVSDNVNKLIEYYNKLKNRFISLYICLAVR